MMKKILIVAPARFNDLELLFFLLQRTVTKEIIKQSFPTLEHSQ